MLEQGFSLVRIFVMLSSDMTTLFNRDFVLALWNMKNDQLQ